MELIFFLYSHLVPKHPISMAINMEAIWQSERHLESWYLLFLSGLWTNCVHLVCWSLTTVCVDTNVPNPDRDRHFEMARAKESLLKLSWKWLDYLRASDHNGQTLSLILFYCTHAHTQTGHITHIWTAHAYCTNLISHGFTILKCVHISLHSSNCMLMCCFLFLFQANLYSLCLIGFCICLYCLVFIEVFQKVTWCNVFVKLCYDFHHTHTPFGFCVGLICYIDVYSSKKYGVFFNCIQC